MDITRLLFRGMVGDSIFEPIRGLDIVKRCTCCHVGYTLTAWRELPLRGHQDDEDARLELRNCPCAAGTTLTLRVDQDGNPVPDPKGVT